MATGMDDHYETNSTPKLTLSKLPCKPKQPLQLMLTPPFHPPVSVPFQWEEAPGKPRSAVDEAPPSSAVPPVFKNKVARCLDLPPRLLKDNDGKLSINMPSPMLVDGPYVGRSLSLACTLSFRKGPVTGREEAGTKFGSGRWESFKEEGKWGDKNRKFTRIGRKRSLFNLSGTNFNLWGEICSSLKQAVPWRMRRRQ